MANTPRIHPSPDLEKAAAGSPVPHPATPLIPSSAAASEKGDPAAPYPPPPPYSKPPSRRRGCRLLRGLCCTLCTLLLLLILLIGIFAAVLFLGFHPKIPHYSVDGLRVTELNLSSDAALSAAFDVNITARNPNKKIGIYYEGGSSLSVWYHDTQLCEGSLPVFYQGHRNTTVMQVVLSGRTADATALAAELQAADGEVPLVIKAKVPVRVKLGKLKLRKKKVRVKCELVVDSLNPNKNISIKSSHCKIHLKILWGIITI